LSALVPPAWPASAAEERLDAELADYQLSAGDFRAIDDRSPIDVEARIAETPLTATAKGMFFEQFARAARKSGRPCEARYVPFRDYSLRDFMRLLADYTRERFPGVPLREGFRRAGWEAYSALMNSVVGRVLFTFAQGNAQAALRLAPQAYKYSLSECSVTARVSTSEQMVLEFRSVWNFPECYQVGAIEGGCRAFGAAPRIRTRVLSPSDVDMLIRW
jgi:uncharacterized protein (TIGR02265 family)